MKRGRVRPAAPAVMLLAAMLVAGCDREPAPTALAPSAHADTSTAMLDLGRKVYNFRCYFCHGYSGDARTLAASYLNPRPRDLRAATPATLPQQAIEAAVRDGRPGSAMKPFRDVLDAAELRAVSVFVATEFVRDKARNTAYHTPENGWPDHERFASAFAFVRGEIALDEPEASLDEHQLRGRRLFLSACISCHDRAHVRDEGPAWSARALSYPRLPLEAEAEAEPEHEHEHDDEYGGVFALHNTPPRLTGLSRVQRRGEKLYQANCAFCHAADGTGGNWIGRFVEPNASDLTRHTEATLPPARLREIIREGLPGTSMPAWQAVLKPAQVEAVGAYVVRAFYRTPPARTTPID